MNTFVNILFNFKLENEIKIFLMLLSVCILVIISPAMLSNHIQIVLKESNYTISEGSLCRGCDSIQSFESYTELENEN